MKRIYFFRSAVAVAMPLLMALSLRADDVVTVTNYNNATGATVGGSAPDSQPNAVTTEATACNGGACCQSDCGCGNLRFCTQSGFIGGAEVAFLKPYFNSNAAFAHLSIDDDGATSTSDFPSLYQASPRVWLGYVNSCGLGGRIRYWNYDQTTSPQTSTNIGTFAPGTTNLLGLFATDTEFGVGSEPPFFDESAGTISTAQHLHIYTVDLETTQWMQLGCWDITFGGGLRDAAVYIDRVNSFTPTGDATVSDVGTSRNHFDGLGPTVFAEFRRPFGCRGLAFVGNVRGSVLFGTKSLRASNTEIVDGRSETYQTYDQTTDNSCVGVAEISMGIEWSTQIACNTTVFAQGLWENQYWDNTGNTGLSSGDSLGLSGFTFALGFAH